MNGDPITSQPNTVATAHFSDEPGVRVMTVSGELDISTSGQLDRELEGLVDTGTPRVVVDLSGVSFMDSSALRALVSAHNRAEQRGQHLALLSPSAACAKVLGITGLDRVLDVI